MGNLFDQRTAVCEPEGYSRRFISYLHAKAILGLIAFAVVVPLSAKAQTFNDVSTDYWAYSFIETLYANGVTAGCGGGSYCPENPVTRAQMAVFVERGMKGSDYAPPAASGSIFNDVAASDFAASFIEQFYLDGITAGCGNNNYCPNGVVSRAQMAVFLLRAKYGAGYSPPAATGVFNDVGLSYWAVRWIEQLAAEGITSGCGNGNYCPEAPVTRAQMAVFLVRTFELTGGGGGNPADFTGTWHVRDMVDATNCGDGIYLDAWTGQATQSGSTVSLLDSEGNTITATVIANTASWTGSFPDSGGTTTITASLTISGNTASGSATWSWTDGISSCSGTTQTTASRGPSPQETEPNNDADQANVISPSNGAAFLAGTVDSIADELDVFSFVLNSGATVEFELSHFSGDLDLLLFDAALNVIAVSESVDVFEAIEANLSAGVYYVVVLAFDTLGASAYELSMDIN